MAHFRATLAGLIACAILVSCAQREVHLHDRHSLSYPLVESYARSHPNTTLVLFDYHHDVGALGEETLSSNWVGRLARDKAISRVLWVSGRDLLLPNNNARIAWLDRKLASFSPSEAASIKSRVVLVDWHEIEKTRLGGPFVVSLDFDIFCHDPGIPPERFVDEIREWIGRQNPGLVTLALSAAYQNDAPAAWRRLERFVRKYGRDEKRARWFLEAGPRGFAAEGLEEESAWRLWERRRETFGRRDEGFLPGAGLWIAVPATLRAGLLEFAIKPGDETANAILSGWRDTDRVALERLFPQAATDEALAAAASAIEDSWRGAQPSRLEADPSGPSGSSGQIGPGQADALGQADGPSQADGLAGPSGFFGASEIGVALRIQDGEGERGCLALYRGVSDLLGAVIYCAQRSIADPRYRAVLPGEAPNLDLELSIFGPWREMSGPLDFKPGFESLILLDGEEVTLLQASVAAQRGYEAKEFLARLSNKAGLGLEGWKNPGLRFLRSTTIWSRRPFSAIEVAPGYQKYEKK